ncbi:MAG: FAD-dependent oxidoreductase [Myxococcota bacterium]
MIRTRGAAPGVAEGVMVVGAGVAGLSAAVLLARRGVEVEVWEAADAPGGLLAPVRFSGHDCDRGSHRVHPAAHPLLLELTRAAAWTERPREGRLVLGGRQIRYPIHPLGFLRGLGVGAAVDMGLGYLLRRAQRDRYRRWEQERGVAERSDRGFEAFVVERVGWGAYRRFYRPYAVKVWGEEPRFISQSVAKQRVSMSHPLRSVLSGRRRASNAGTFLYPRTGMAELIRLLRAEAEALGVRMRFGRRFDVANAPPDRRPIIFSGNLGDLVPDAGLEHRGLYLLHLSFPADAVSEVDTWYVPEGRYWFGRVSQPAQFSSGFAQADRTILCVEIPEGRWGARRNFLQDLDSVAEQLRHAGILRRDAGVIDASQTFVPGVYPLYVRGWYDRWQQALQRVSELGNVFPVGRQGLFLHCNMDHSVRIAADAVEHLVGGGSVEGWMAQCSRYLDFQVRD